MSVAEGEMETASGDAHAKPFHEVPPGHTVVMVSVKIALPPEPVAVHTQVDGEATQAALAGPVALPLICACEPLPAKPDPVEVQVHDTALALVVFQVTV
jgi:hypothetical protein